MGRRLDVALGEMMNVRMHVVLEGHARRVAERERRVLHRADDRAPEVHERELVAGQVLASGRREDRVLAYRSRPHRVVVVRLGDGLAHAGLAACRAHGAADVVVEDDDLLGAEQSLEHLRHLGVVVLPNRVGVIEVVE